MSDQPSHNLGGLAIDLVRRIDEACRRFEADWRTGRRPRVEDYLVDVSDEGRSALLAELEALGRELASSAETIAHPGAGSPTLCPPPMPPPATVADAPTIAPAMAVTPSPADAATTDIHGEPTLPPRDEATVDHDPAGPARLDPGEPVRIRYFGDYELIREIARGGMGVVFRARQTRLNRTVALKMILAGQLANDTEVKRFYTEAEAAAQLDHPGIVPIFEIGQHEGQHYFSMGFVEGQSLAQRLADGPLPAREAAELIGRVSEAIAYAHRQGVIHRDIKPANILLDRDGSPRVTDFGLAKRIQGDSGLTGSGQIMGTPSYMPPEQAGGNRGEVGPAADIYALGATLYALVTGRPPFQAATPMDTVIQVISEEPVPPRRLNPALDRDLETICLKCLEKGPPRRYASASDLAADLGRYLAGEPIVARPVTKAERAVKWARRKPAIAGLLGLVTLVTALGLGGVLWQWRAAVQARNEAQDREQDALKAQAREREQTELAQQRLYDVRMNLVQRYWEDYNGTLLQQGLVEQLPANQGGIDRRGFEWSYWQRKMSSGHITLKGHTSRVSSVAFSPDGRHLASAGDDFTVKVWDAATGQETLTLKESPVKVRDAATGRETVTIKGLGRGVSSVAFSPDGTRLASGCGDGTVEVRDTGTWKEIRTLKGHTSRVSSVAFSPDGQRLASAGEDRTVKVWDTGTGQETLTFRGHTNWVGSVAFSPDGRRIASVSGFEVKVWDTGTGTETLTLKGYDGGVAFSPDGRRLASGGRRGTVAVWDAATGQETLTLKGHNGVVSYVAFSPDGTRLASACGDGTVKLWDARTGQETLTFKGHTDGVESVAFSPDGKRLTSASRDGTVKLWDTGTGQETLTLKGPILASYVAFSPDGQRLISGGFDWTVKVWNTETWKEILTLKGDTGVLIGVAFSPDGRRLATVNLAKLAARSTVKVWDTGTWKETLTLKGHTSVAFSPDGKRLASAGQDQTVKVWDARTGQETLTLKGHNGPVMYVAFSPDGKRLASASRDGTVKLWDTATGQETLTFKGHNGGVLSVAFSPDGKRLASAGATLKVWDAATGQETLTLKGPSHVSYVAFSPDGKRLASADGATVKVWDAATGQETLTLKGHHGGVLKVAFSPDGKRLASAGQDQTVKVWDARTGQETLTLKGHNGPVMYVAFSPDGHRLASASADGTIKVWDARPLDEDQPKPDLSRR